MSPSPRRSGVRIFRRVWTSAAGEKRAAWSAQWKALDGSRKTAGGFPSKATAEAYFRREVLPALEAGHDSPKARRESEPTIAEFVETYLARKRADLRASSFRLISRTAREFARFAGGGRSVSEVTRYDVERFVSAPLRNGEPSSGWTQQHRRSVVARVFNLARALQVTNIRPTENVVTAPARHRLRFLSSEEIERVLKVARDPEFPAEALPFVSLAIYAGLRKGEILSLRWSRVELDAAKPVIRIERDDESGWEPKTRSSTRVLGIHPALLPILRAFRDQQRLARDLKSEIAYRVTAMVDAGVDPPYIASRLRAAGYLRASEHAPLGLERIAAIERGRLELFAWQKKRDLLIPPSRPGVMMRQNCPTWWDTIRIRAGIPDVPFHVLRHTFASHAAMANVQLPQLAAMLGHASLSAVAIYAHLCPTHVQDVGRSLPDFAATHREHEQGEGGVRGGSDLVAD